MRFVSVLAIFASAATLAGCAAVPRDWIATGGSRADGVVRLSYEYGEFDQVQLSEAQAVSVASARCKVWGYDHAEAFGGISRQCQARGGFSGCRQWMVTKEYQCLGQPKSTP